MGAGGPTQPGMSRLRPHEHRGEVQFNPHTQPEKKTTTTTRNRTGQLREYFVHGANKGYGTLDAVRNNNRADLMPHVLFTQQMSNLQTPSLFPDTHPHTQARRHLCPLAQPLNVSASLKYLVGILKGNDLFRREKRCGSFCGH